MLVRIGDITESCLGKMLDAEKNQGEYEPYLANLNVRWGSFDVDHLSKMRFKPDEQERYGIENGDLIMCEGGEPGRCAIWHGDVPNMKIQKALHRIRAKEGLDIEYLYYWFLYAGRNHMIDGYFTGSTIKHLPGDKLKEIEIDLPEFRLQQSVSSVLSRIDAKIQNNNKLSSTLESLAKTIYDYWFVQFDFPDENGKPYMSSGGKMVWNEELKREIPEGWEVRHVADLTTVKTGKHDANFATSNGEYAYFTCGQDILKCDEAAFFGRAVLLAGNGDFNVKHYTGEFNAYQRTYVLIPYDAKYYAALYFATRNAIDGFTKGSAGSIVKFITLGDVNNITLFVLNREIYTMKIGVHVYEMENDCVGLPIILFLVFSKLIFVFTMLEVPV